MPSESELRVSVRRPGVNRPDTGWRSPSLGSMKTLERNSSSGTCWPLPMKLALVPASLLLLWLSRSSSLSYGRGGRNARSVLAAALNLSALPMIGSLLCTRPTCTMNTGNNSIAFGKPGITPRWTSSAKEGLGTAFSGSCRLWFTLSHGIVNEIYYPTVDQPNTRDFEFLISDGETFCHEEKRDLDHNIDYPATQLSFLSPDKLRAQRPLSSR